VPAAACREFDLAQESAFGLRRTGRAARRIPMMGPCFEQGKRTHPMQAFQIVVIGAGQTGTPLLQQLLDAPFVQLRGVADLDLNQPGIALARARGVPVTTHFMELVDPSVDIIIDVTGSPQVREALRSKMVETGNTHTLIMHEAIALLMMSLSAGRQVASRHGDLEYS
jgi:predicted homoserine dehydrogenase-like protein